MKIFLVGNRDGKAAVNWPGVLLTMLIVATLAIVGAAGFMVVVGWFSPIAIFLAASFGISCVATWVHQSLQLPIEQLTPLG